MERAASRSNRYDLRPLHSLKATKHYEAGPVIMPGGGPDAPIFDDDFAKEEHDSYDPMAGGGYKEYYYDHYIGEVPFADMRPSDDRTMFEMMGGIDVVMDGGAHGSESEDDDTDVDEPNIKHLIDDSDLSPDEIKTPHMFSRNELPNDNDKNDFDYIPGESDEESESEECGDEDDSDYEGDAVSTEDEEDD